VQREKGLNQSVHDAPISCLGENISAQGIFFSKGNLQICGRLAGRVDGAHQVTIAAQASFQGPLTAESLPVVAGAKVEAELKIGPFVRPTQTTTVPTKKPFAFK
jgi:cytoskeletal protein CcmA (bactofilin family)